LTVPTFKNEKIKIQDGGGRHLEKSKKRHIAGIQTHKR